jgi:ABC-type microcin C transport system permease subunit YejB
MCSGPKTRRPQFGATRNAPLLTAATVRLATATVVTVTVIVTVIVIVIVNALEAPVDGMMEIVTETAMTEIGTEGIETGKDAVGHPRGSEAYRRGEMGTGPERLLRMIATVRET